MFKFLYLTSAYYSGSTLLAFLLNAHPNIASIGELNKVNLSPVSNLRCSCQNFLRDCEFWEKVMIHLRRRYRGCLPQPYRVGLLAQDDTLLERLQFANLRNNTLSDLRDFCYRHSSKYSNRADHISKNNLNLAEAILSVTGKRVFFDTSKNAHRIMFFNKYMPSQVKVVHLIRDGRGVFDSFKRYYPKMTDREAITRWLKSNFHSERALKYIKSENAYVLLYKNLVQNPERELGKLFEFIGEKYSALCSDYRAADHHIIGNNRMRFRMDTKIYYDNKWKTSLSHKQINLFDQLAGKRNKKYGYS